MIFGTMNPNAQNLNAEISFRMATNGRFRQP